MSVPSKAFGSKGLFETSYAYAWREDELLGLRVQQLDFMAKIIDLGKTKNGDQRMVTMTEHLQRILVRCAYGKKPDDFVFTREDGTPVKDFRDAWWNALHPGRIRKVPMS